MNLQPDSSTGEAPPPEERFTCWVHGAMGGGVFHHGTSAEDAEKKARAYARRKGYPRPITGLCVTDPKGEVVKEWTRRAP